MNGSSVVPVRSRLLSRWLANAASVFVGLGLIVAALAPASAAVPGAPTRLLAIASDGSVRLGWFRPANDGGQPITAYRVRSSAGTTVDVTDDPATLRGLPNNVAVRFQVAAINADGRGPFSAFSNTVTPRAATATNTWAATGRQVTGRFMSTAVRIAGGKVLVVGGNNGDSPPERSTELYDITSGTWSLTQPLGRRNAFTTTRLSDGRVLVTGGRSATFAVLQTTRLYDPATGTWSTAAPMLSPRSNHTATLLADGRVLVAGGVTGPAAVTATAELYNPATNTWSTTRSMSEARFAHSAIRRLDGRVLVAGGTDGSIGRRSAEVYVPTTGAWVNTSDMTTARENDEICCKQAVLLASGRVLVAGGYNGGVLRSAELYNPATGAWTATGSMRVAREGGFSLVRLPDGRVLAFGGLDDYGPLKYAELYNETTGTWTRVNDMRLARFGTAAAPLPAGRVLAVSGNRLAEIFTAN